MEVKKLWDYSDIDFDMDLQPNGVTFFFKFFSGSIALAGKEFFSFLVKVLGEKTPKTSKLIMFDDVVNILNYEKILSVI